MWRVGLVVLFACGKPAPHDERAPIATTGDRTANTADTGASGVAYVGDAGVARVDGSAASNVTTDGGATSSAMVDGGATISKTDGGATSSVTIVDVPMAWSDERAKLTLEYRQRHSDPDATDLDIAPRVIVLHYTDGGSAKATRAYFDNPRIEKERPELAKAGAVNVSSHFVVDRDGTIYRLQPETRFARHCIGLNHIAIGIENVGDEAKFPLTDAQVAADAALVRDLARRFPITHLLGHYEVMKFRSNAYYVERDAAYHNDKPDPGARFMARVRERVADLGLAGL